MLRRTPLLLTLLILSLACCTPTLPYDLGNGYKLVGEGGYTKAIVDSSNTLKIGEHILSYAFDSTFIIVMQSPPDSLPKMKLLYYSKSDQKKIALDNSIFKQFWIINKKQIGIYSLDSVNYRAKYSNVYGPYDKNEYLRQCGILNVPHSLKFENY